MIPATFRRGKIYNNQVSTPRPCQAAAKLLGCPSARVAMDALTLVGDGVEVVGRTVESLLRAVTSSALM